MSTRLHHQAQALASVLPPLLIEADRVAATVHQGTHGRRRAGTGETFWQFRPYEPGDPVERIDWRQSARTDKIFIREREWEAAQTAYIWADTSGSMQYASSQQLPTKAERAQLLMLASASLALRGGEKVVWLDRRHIVAHGKNGLEAIAMRLGQAIGENMPPDVPVARHAHVVLCSDFLMPPEKLAALIQRYAALNLRGVLVHVLDPVENVFALQGRLNVEGCEGEAAILVPKADALCDAYQQRLNQHKTYLAHIAKSAGWFYGAHVTDQLPHMVLTQIYEYLAAE